MGLIPYIFNSEFHIFKGYVKKINAWPWPVWLSS